jgi:hypothetical protein
MNGNLIIGRMGEEMMQKWKGKIVDSITGE